jgi:hypothetical protein
MVLAPHRNKPKSVKTEKSSTQPEQEPAE